MEVSRDLLARGSPDGVVGALDFMMRGTRKPWAICPERETDYGPSYRLIFEYEGDDDVPPALVTLELERDALEVVDISSLEMPRLSPVVYNRILQIFAVTFLYPAIDRFGLTIITSWPGRNNCAQRETEI